MESFNPDNLRGLVGLKIQIRIKLPTYKIHIEIKGVNYEKYRISPKDSLEALQSFVENLKERRRVDNKIQKQRQEQKGKDTDFRCGRLLPTILE